MMKICNREIKKCAFILILIIIVINTFLYIDHTDCMIMTKEQSNNLTKVDSNSITKDSTDAIQTVTTSDEYDGSDSEPDGSDITTKIYKSSSPTSELLDGQPNLNSTTDDDLLNKNELIKKRGASKSGLKRIEKNKTFSTSNKNNHMFLPWLALILLILVLGFIFSVLIRKKI